MGDLTAQQTAARLGVKLDTIYAYVSRGALQSHRRAGSRTSLFDSDEVERLALRGRPRRTTRPTALDVVIESQLTSFGEGEVFYRGRDISELAVSMTFEQAAHWLWTGEETEESRRWTPVEIDLPDVEDPRQRLQCAAVLAAAKNPLRSDLTPSSVVRTGSALIATMATALPIHPAAPRRARSGARSAKARASVAELLWSRLSPVRPNAKQLALMNATLVVTADYELVPATLAARVAASVRADPYAVALTGLGALAGRLHGRTNRIVYEMLGSAGACGAGPALERSLEVHGFYPGFGQYSYPQCDPRGGFLVDLVREACPSSAVLQTVQELMDVARSRANVLPNIDMGLAVVALAYDMPPHAGEVMLTVARTAGWLAHALEEYGEAPARFRARALPRT